MKQLGRALRMTLKYRWSLLGSLGCSIMVAILWGANLGAVYPFVEIVLQNKTLPQWADEQIVESTQRIALLESAIAPAENDEVVATDGAATNAITNPGANAAARAYELKSERKRLATIESWLPVIKRYAPGDAFRTLLYLMAVMFAATVVRCVCLLGNMVLTARAGHRTVLDLQHAAFGNVLNLEAHETSAGGTSDLISRIRTETSIIGLTSQTLYGKTIREPLKMIACLGGAAWVNWRLLLLSLLAAPLAGFIMNRLAKATKRAARVAIEQSANLMDRLYEALTYQRVVKAFTMEDVERERFQTVAGDIYRKRMRIAWLEALSRNNSELLGITMITLSVLAGGYLALTQQTHLFGIRLTVQPMDFGHVMMFFGFLIGAADPLRKLSDVYNHVQQGVVAANRVFPLIDRRAAVREPADPLPIPAGPLTIEVKDVCFAYRKNEPVLNGVSLAFAAGTSTAIVGHNGCGKSTLINLLPRFFDPCSKGIRSGSVRANGVDLRDCSVRELRSKIGYVTQETMLFNDTIANNISYGSPDASREQVIEAATKAHAIEFIEALTDGFDTQLGSAGQGLSGGQRQRISLARAILKDPELLILDEATSQIDPESERLIHSTLAEFIRNRTTIMITHRLSTLDLVDQIVVMRDGQVLDLGTHEGLLSRCADYLRMRTGLIEEAA